MSYLCQRDPRWASYKIGYASFTAGQKGCAFTALLELWQSLTGLKITAKDYISYVTDVSLFTDRNHPIEPGLILWDRVCARLNKQFGTTIRYDGTESGNKRASQLAALKAVGKGCLLQVNNGAHFVTLWGQVKGDAKELTCVDPWVGEKRPVFKTYHNITGARYFSLAEPAKTPKAITSKFIKGAGSPEIYAFNGKNAFHVPDMETLTFLSPGGAYEVVSDAALDKIPEGPAIPSLK